MDEHYVSPDAKLRLIILREQEDVTIGFEFNGVRTDWHTHPEVIDGDRQIAGLPALDYE